jgi:hypothetical protein
MANLFDAIGAASNRVLGGLGRTIDVVGNAAGNYLPEMNWSENLEYQGSKSLTPEQRVTERVEQGKPIAGQDTQIGRDLGLNFTYDTGAGISGDKPAYNIQEQQSALGKAPSSQFTSGELQSLGLSTDLYNGQEITISGQKYRVKDNGNGTRSFEPITPSQKTNLSGQDKANALSGAGSDILRNLDQGNINDLLNKQFDNMNDFAKEIERVARENAEREYGTILQALGRQRGEVTTLAGEQKENISKQGEMAEEDLSIRSDKEQKEIDKQRSGFVEGVEETKDQLARNWRDMSLQVQRIMRGRGISDSTFASSEELKVLRDFNQGLRQLAVKKSGALKDFADAITETNSFYERKKVELAEEVRVNLQKVDQWVRQRTIDIQNQEGMALSNKLSQINDANLRAEGLRTNIKNEILQKQMDYDMWIKQTEVNYKMAVATAAKGKVQTANDQIKEAAALSKNMFTLLQNGQAHYTQMENGQWAIQDSMTGAAIPTTQAAKDRFEEEQDLQQQILQQRATGNDAFSQLFGGGAVLGGAQTQEEEERTGMFGGIMQGLGL